MHPLKNGVPATDESANSTSQGRLEHSSSGQASAPNPHRWNVATRFGDTLGLWIILACVTLFALALKVDELICDAIDAIEGEYEL